MEEEILTIKELAKYLKINERTVYLLAKEKKIPGIKIGGSWRFKKEMIDNWIKNSSKKDS
jgi:excisionase family DNA binding protein